MPTANPPSSGWQPLDGAEALDGAETNRPATPAPSDGPMDQDVTASVSSPCPSLISAKENLFPAAAGCLILLTILAIAYSLYFSKAVMLPIAGAFLANFLFSPIVAKLKDWGIPNFVGAMFVIIGLMGGTFLGVSFAYQPATEWLSNREQNLEIIENKLLVLSRPYKTLQKMTHEIENLGTHEKGAGAAKIERKDLPHGQDPQAQNTKAQAPAARESNDEHRDRTDSAATVSRWRHPSLRPHDVTALNESMAPSDQQRDADPSSAAEANQSLVENAVVPVEVQQPSISNRIFSTTGDVVAGVGLLMVLLFYLLSAGDRGLEKLVQLMPSMHQKKRTVQLSRAIEKSVSSYLVTTFTINFALGIVIGLGMWLIGLPHPVLWAVIAMLLNFFPFLGAMGGAVLVFLAAVISFDSVGYALWAPGIYLTANLIEANLITPLLLSRSVSLHPVWLMIFFVIVSWIWGLGGAIIAVPTLAVIKITCDHIQPLEPIGQFLGR